MNDSAADLPPTHPVNVRPHHRAPSGRQVIGILPGECCLLNSALKRIDDCVEYHSRAVVDARQRGDQQAAVYHNCAMGDALNRLIELDDRTVSLDEVRSN